VPARLSPEESIAQTVAVGVKAARRGAAHVRDGEFCRPAFRIVRRFSGDVVESAWPLVAQTFRPADGRRAGPKRAALLPVLQCALRLEALEFFTLL